MVAIGCQGGGNGGGGGGGGGGGSTGGDSTAFVSMPASPGLLNVSYITGQGRGRGPDSPSAIIRRVFFIDQLNDDVNDDPANAVETVLNPERAIGLDQYSIQTIGVDVPMPSGTESRMFDTFYLQVQRIRVENNGGGYDEFDMNGAPAVDESMAMTATALRGRHTTIPVFLDDAMLNAPGGNISFDRALFEQVNYDPDENKIIAFLGDYLMFDISQMANPDRPIMSSGAPAARVFFSGDGQAISETTSGGAFEVLIPTGYLEGTFNDPAPPTNLGTYTLVQVDPRDLNGIAKITSLLGSWRGYNQVIGSLGAFEFIALPSSRDDGVQDIVMIQRNGAGKITNMFYGLVDYAAGILNAWPIRNLDDGVVTNEITGTVTDLVDKNGSPVGTDYHKIREGRFAFDTPDADLPGTFPLTGRFIVFRR